MPQSLVQVYLHVVFSTKGRQPFLLDVSPSHVERLIEYIGNQQEHYKHESFQEEFRRICAKYGVAIDERYAWD